MIFSSAAVDSLCIVRSDVTPIVFCLSDVDDEAALFLYFKMNKMHEAFTVRLKSLDGDELF